MCAVDGLVGSLDELVTALHQDLDGHIVGDCAVFDDFAHEVEVGLTRRREPNLDLLEAHGDERIEHLALAGRVHRTPQRCFGYDLAGPGAIRQVDRGEWLVPLERHAGGLLSSVCSGIRRHGSSPSLWGFRL